MKEDQDMLEFIRKHRQLFMLIFIVSALGLVISMGLPGSSRGNAGSAFGFLSFGSKTVAKVGSQEVSSQELEQDIFRREEQFRKMFGSQLNTEQGRKFYDQIRKAQLNPDKILDELVQRKIFFHLFEEQKQQISQGAVRSQLEQLPYFQKNGKFDAAQYKKMVTAPHDFENSLRDQLKGEKVLEPFAFVASMVTEGEVATGRLMAKKKDFELLQVNPKVIKKEVTVTDAEVEKIVADATKTTELQTYYNRNIREYKRPEEISAKHILIRDEDGGEKKIKEIQAEIKSGKISFEEAAKKYSKDPSNAPKGGDLGYFGKGVMDKSFEEAAFALKKPEEMSDVVKTSFGFHLIKLTARKDAVEKKFDDVKKDLAREYVKDQKKLGDVKALVASWLKMKRGPEAAQLKAYDLSWTKVPGWNPSQGRLGFLNENDVKVDELMALNKDKPLLNRAIEITGGIALVRWTGEKDDPVTMEELAFQKAIRLTDLYLQNYKKNLEQNKEIHKNEKVIAQVKKALDL